MSSVATVLLPVDPTWQSVAPQTIILNDVSWETYEQLLAEHTGSGTHFAYDQGNLEIMVLSVQHETLKHILALLVDLIAGEMEIDIYAAGSTIFRRRDSKLGFEPDACFYFQKEALVRGKDKIDLYIDPPPELVLEIDITSPTLNKFPIFAALGIAEVWRYDGERVRIWRLDAGSYHEQVESQLLPKVTSMILTEFLESGRQLKRTAWLRRVQTWVRQLAQST
ncbi:MAG: Uma2 family endonuclease [Caldilineaceae bacterium]|nr:Uma2 family endonuclease [Caldilineaceae bacterium]